MQKEIKKEKNCLPYTFSTAYCNTSFLFHHLITLNVHVITQFILLGS